MTPGPDTLSGVSTQPEPRRWISLDTAHLQPRQPWARRLASVRWSTSGADKIGYRTLSVSTAPDGKARSVQSESPGRISLDTGCFQPEEPGFGPAVTFAPGRDWPPPSQALCG